MTLTPLDGTTPPYPSRFIATFEATVPVGGEWTTDDITDIIGFPDPSHAANAKNSSLGPIVRSLVREGRIVSAGRTEKARSKTRHSSIVQVWKRMR